jgi:hypothetical protein
MLHTQVVRLVFEGFNELNMNGACWMDADGNIRQVKPYLAHWAADGKERQILTGRLKVQKKQKNSKLQKNKKTLNYKNQ